MPAHESVILEARNLSKSFRSGTTREVRALQEVFLSIATGSFCALTGLSGCGKTTLRYFLSACRGHRYYEQICKPSPHPVAGSISRLHRGRHDPRELPWRVRRFA